ncbi:STAS domain-containing protein [Actinoplanes sp. NPDC026619]|uniref:STAS domain-containing protein n=1 Tax=Actinoplanes sp. NPDC026619 TaxID=3155798 RepID=UPI0033DA0671
MTTQDAAFAILSRHTTTGIQLAVTGEIDMYTTGHLDRAIAEALRTDAGDLSVDLAATTFCDCAGITTLLAGRRDALAAHIGYQVSNPTGLPLKVLQTAGVHTLLTTAASC